MKSKTWIMMLSLAGCQPALDSLEVGDEANDLAVLDDGDSAAVNLGHDPGHIPDRAVGGGGGGGFKKKRY